jgi:hypothetical protein
MPILNKSLDHRGHANLELLLVPSAPRRAALQKTGQPLPAPLVVSGQIDTGATLTIIDPQVRQALHLTPFRVRRLGTPGAPAPIRAFSYKLDLGVIDARGHVWTIYEGLTVVEAAIAHTGTAVLVGCDVLSRCQFTHNGTVGTYSLAY